MRSTRGGGGLGEVSLPPKAPRGAFHHMDSSMVETLGAWAYRGWCPWPMKAKAHPLQPMWPPGTGGPTRWTPGTLPVVPVEYR